MPEHLERYQQIRGDGKQVQMQGEENLELNHIIDTRIDSKASILLATLVDLVPGFDKKYQEHLASQATTKSAD